MPQNVASDQGLHCLPLIQQFLGTSAGSKIDFSYYSAKTCCEYSLELP